jgi:hypothetical protein
MANSSQALPSCGDKKRDETGNEVDDKQPCIEGNIDLQYSPVIVLLPRLVFG